MFNEKVNLNETRRRGLEQKEKFVSQSARRGVGGGGRDWDLPVDKGRPRSKNSIISADARTSLGFPGADNGALFEESFRAHG